MTLIIGLCGPQHAGKSSIAKEAVHILTGRGISARTLSFADPLRSMLTALLLSSGMDPAQAAHALTDQTAKETPLAMFGGKTPRYALQTLGTDWGRALISPDLWVNIAMQNIAANPSDVVILDDVRFDREIEIILTRAGSIVEISRIGTAYSEVHLSAMRPAFRRGAPIPLYNGNYLHNVAKALLTKVLDR